MDQETGLQRLQQAERHVAQGERHIAGQEERIAQLARRGADTTEAQRLLNNFFALQIQHIQHRDRIRKELVERI
jgi:hypothetical protein